MKKIITIGLFFVIFLCTAKATHYIGYYYDFPYFKYYADQLMGSLSVAPDMYPTTIKLNDYVADLVEKGKLKDKPVVYDLGTSIGDDFKRKRFLLEVYETDFSYRIIVNYQQFYTMSFTQKELIKIIDYLAHPDFEPFYCDTTLSKINLTQQVFFKKIDPLVKNSQFEEKEDYNLYTDENLKIKFVDNFIEVTDAENKITKLNYPIAQPIRFKNRIILMNDDCFLVYEAGICIKRIKIHGLLWDMDAESNSPDTKIFSDWMNIYHYDEVAFSYSYSQNRFYVLKN